MAGHLTEGALSLARMRVSLAPALSGLLLQFLVGGAPRSVQAQSSYPDDGEPDSAAAPTAAPAPAPAPRLTPRLRPRPVVPSAPAPAAPPPQVAPAPAKAPVTQSTPLSPLAIAPASAAFYPPVLPAYKDLAPPPGYVETRQWNAAFLVGGGVVLAATYAASLGYGASQDYENGLGGLAVPVFGPWISLANRDFNCDVDSATDVDGIADSQESLETCIAEQTTAAGFLVGLGVGQLVGAALVTVGLLDSRRRWVRADLAGVEVGFDVAANPYFSGLQATGQF